MFELFHHIGFNITAGDTASLLCTDSSAGRIHGNRPTTEIVFFIRKCFGVGYVAGGRRYDCRTPCVSIMIQGIGSLGAVFGSNDLVALPDIFERACAVVELEGQFIQRADKICLCKIDVTCKAGDFILIGGNKIGCIIVCIQMIGRCACINSCGKSCIDGIVKCLTGGFGILRRIIRCIADGICLIDRCCQFGFIGTDIQCIGRIIELVLCGVDIGLGLFTDDDLILSLRIFSKEGIPVAGNDLILAACKTVDEIGSLVDFVFERGLVVNGNIPSHFRPIGTV